MSDDRTAKHMGKKKMANYKERKERVKEKKEKESEKEIFL
jgi:hypothetical protein